MMFWNILKNDIARGIFKRKYLYIISTVVIAALVIIADMSLGRKSSTATNRSPEKHGNQNRIYPP